MSNTPPEAGTPAVAQSQSRPVGWYIGDYAADAALMTFSESVMHSLPALMAQGVTGFSWVAAPVVGAVMISEMVGKVGNHILGRRLEAEHSSHKDGIFTFIGKEALPALTFAAIMVTSGAATAGVSPLATAAYIAAKHMFVTAGLSNAIRNRAEAPFRQVFNTLNWASGKGKSP